MTKGQATDDVRMQRHNRNYDLDSDHHGNPTSLMKSFAGPGQVGPEKVVLDKDGKPCRTCHDFKTWAKLMNKEGTARDSNFKPSEEEIEVLHRSRLQCPVDKDELGQSTWKFLHTLSMQYPETPSQADQKDMNQFMTLLAKFYPCQPCAEDLRQDLKVNPPRVATGHDFATWMCEAHNRVNVKLGKPEFDCSRVFERWRDGWRDGSCD